MFNFIRKKYTLVFTLFSFTFLIFFYQNCSNTLAPNQNLATKEISSAIEPGVQDSTPPVGNPCNSVAPKSLKKFNSVGSIEVALLGDSWANNGLLSGQLELKLGNVSKHGNPTYSIDKFIDDLKWQEDIVNYSPDLLLITMGINDFFWGREPNVLVNNLKLVLNIAISKLPNTEIIFLIPPKTGNTSPAQPWRNYVDKIQTMINDLSRVSFLNQQEFVPEYGVDNNRYWTNSSHINKDGAEKVASGIFSKVTCAPFEPPVILEPPVVPPTTPEPPVVPPTTPEPPVVPPTTPEPPVVPPTTPEPPVTTSKCSKSPLASKIFKETNSLNAVMIGDSWVGYPSGAITEAFFPLINGGVAYGYPGYTFPYLMSLNYSGQPNPHNWKDKIAQQKPDIIYVSTGVNDFVKKHPIANFQSDFRIFINTIKDKSPMSEIVLLVPAQVQWSTVIPWSDYRKVYFDMEQEYEGVGTLDQGSVIPPYHSTSDPYWQNSTHLNSAGGKKVADYIFENLNCKD